MTPSHLFQIGSITKSFVALVLLAVARRGQARPAQAGPRLSARSAHRDGIRHGDDSSSAHSYLGAAGQSGVFSADPSARLIQGFKPGEHFHYCNAGFDILGELAAKLDGRPWRIAVS